VEALTKQNGVRLFGKLKKKLKKKVKTDLPYLSFYKKPETHIFFFLPHDFQQSIALTDSFHTSPLQESNPQWQSWKALALTIHHQSRKYVLIKVSPIFTIQINSSPNNQSIFYCYLMKKFVTFMAFDQLISSHSTLSTTKKNLNINPVLSPWQVKSSGIRQSKCQAQQLDANDRILDRDACWLGLKKIHVVPVSYREKIRVGRSEINFFFVYFFHGFGVFLLGDLQ
jgi:hypothetical protein